MCVPLLPDLCLLLVPKGKEWCADMHTPITNVAIARMMFIPIQTISISTVSSCSVKKKWDVS